MNNSLSYNLFSNFQPVVFRAIKQFLSQKKSLEENDKTVNTTLRIPAKVKAFYDCLASSEMTSINTSITNTLSKVMEQTIDDYQQKYTKINDAFNYQLDSVLKMIDTCRVDYNDFCSLLEWACDKKISRIEITNKEILINLLEKPVQLKLCKLFGYSYEWLLDNTYHSFQSGWSTHEYRWYKNVQSFIKNLINNFYLDETVESFRLVFLSCDYYCIRNINQNYYPDHTEYITPVVEVNRIVNGVKLITYHQFEPNDINYGKCRQHFIVLVKMIEMLALKSILGYPACWIISSQDHDKIRDGSMHVSEVVRRIQPFAFYVCDLENAKTWSSASDSERKTDMPNMLHALDIDHVDKIISYDSFNEKRIEITNELLESIRMSKRSFEKLIVLFYKVCDSSRGHNFVTSHQDGREYLNLDTLRWIHDAYHQNKYLDTSFG